VSLRPQAASYCGRILLDEVIQQFGRQRIDRLPTLLGAGSQPRVQIVGNAEEQLSHAGNAITQEQLVLSFAAP
jgi:hypothetical protein